MYTYFIFMLCYVLFIFLFYSFLRREVSINLKSINYSYKICRGESFCPSSNCSELFRGSFCLTVTHKDVCVLDVVEVII